MTNYKEEYKWNELPDMAIGSVALEEMGFSQDEAHEIMLYFDKKGTHILYTQVDGEDEVYYVKGEHFVNRTGVYALLPKN